MWVWLPTFHPIVAFHLIRCGFSTGLNASDIPRGADWLRLRPPGQPRVRSLLYRRATTRATLRMSRLPLSYQGDRDDPLRHAGPFGRALPQLRREVDLAGRHTCRRSVGTFSP